MSKAVFTVRESALPATYEATSINPGLDACAAARQIANKRYLRADVPSIPVCGCSKPQGCSCRYKHWDDRRQEDHRGAVSNAASQYLTNDRRSGKDRRQPS